MRRIWASVILVHLIWEQLTDIPIITSHPVAVFPLSPSQLDKDSGRDAKEQEKAEAYRIKIQSLPVNGKCVFPSWHRKFCLDSKTDTG